MLLGVLALVVSSVCDNLRGPILPLLSERLSLSHAQAAGFLIACSAAAFLFNLASSGLLARWSERRYLFAAAALQGSGIAALAFAARPAALPVAGLLWGAGNSALGLCANLLVIRRSAPERRARAMSGLHLFYGLSSVLPPVYVSFGLRLGLGLRGLLLGAILLPLALLAAAGAADGGSPDPDPSERVAGDRSDGVLVLALCVALYVLGEVLASTWLVSFLHGEGASLEEANRFLGRFFLVLAASRAVGMVALRPRAEPWVPPLSAALAAALLLAGQLGWRPGYLCAAAAMGPFFPTMMSVISREYPTRYRSVLPIVYATMTVCLAAGHLAMGALGDWAGLRSAFLLPPLCLALSLPLYAWHRRLAPHRREGVI